MRVVFADDISHHTGRFLISLVPVIAELAHGVEDPSVHRLQSVAHIGQGTPHDHAHGIVHIGLAHFVFDVYGKDLPGELGHKNNLLLGTARAGAAKTTKDTKIYQAPKNDK